MDKTAQGFVDDTLEIERLAKLSALDYEREREAVAEKLGVRVSMLDAEVKKARDKSNKEQKHVAPTFDPDELQRSAGRIIHCADILGLFAQDFACVIAGEEVNGKLLYLVSTSRLFDNTMHAAIKGTSAGGKSEIRKRVLEFFPPESVVSFTSLSEKALIYYDGDFAHKILSMGEAAATEEQNFQDYLLRELMTERRIRYPTVQKVGGELIAITIEKNGPVTFLVTTTKNKLHPENETRMLSLEIDDSEKQTKRVLGKVAQVEGLNHSATQVDCGPWQDFQRWLELGERRVVAPFATVMVELIPPAAVRLRRDVGQVIRAIKAHALLHRDQRGRDQAGQIIADIEHDYATVRALLNSILAEGSGVAVNKAMAETIEAVATATDGMSETEGASAQDIARALKLDKSAARRRLLAARDEGFVINLELRRGMPGRYRVTLQKIEPINILPDAATLTDRFRDMCLAGTPPESVPPCHRDEKQDADQGDDGGKTGGKPVDDGGNGGKPVANGLATDKSLKGNPESPPVARWQHFSGGYEREECAVDSAAAIEPSPDDDLTISPFLRQAYQEEFKARAASEASAISAGSDDKPDDLTIPPHLDRRHEICAWCGQPGGGEWDYRGLKVRLHERCERQSRRS